MIGREILVFTDGSFHKNNDNIKASYGYYIKIYDNNECLEYNEYRILEEQKTNNRAELLGMIIALEKLLEIYKINDIIKIYSDSKYTICCLTEWILLWKNNGWKTANKKLVKNIDLIKQMDELYNKLKMKNSNIIIKHIYSHQKEPKNKDTIEWTIWNGNNIVDTNLQNIIK